MMVSVLTPHGHAPISMNPCTTYNIFKIMTRLPCVPSRAVEKKSQDAPYLAMIFLETCWGLEAALEMASA